MSAARKLRRPQERRYRDLEDFVASSMAAPPGVRLVVVEHDAACSPLGCRCKPTYRVSEATPENLAAAAAAEAQWRKGSIS